MGEKNYTTPGLSIIDDMTSEELQGLVDIMQKNGRGICSLSERTSYGEGEAAEAAYRNAVKKVFRKYGSHTLGFVLNSYVDILRKVCEKMEISNVKNTSMERMEQELLKQVMDQTWARMTEEQKAAVLASGEPSMNYKKAAGFAVATLAGRWIGLLTGPVGIGLTALYTIWGFGGAAYRVVIPATIYIAAIRQVHQAGGKNA